MPRVFIPQIPSRYDTNINAWVPTVNIDNAKQFGEVFVMLPPEASRLETDKIVELLQKAMVDYCDDDYVLALGDPVVIAIASAIADRSSSPLRILRWDKRSRNYQLLEANLDNEETPQ